MDPLTCLSVAGTVVQFVDFSFKILSGAHQLYTKGKLDVHQQTAAAIHDLSVFSKDMRRSLRVSQYGRDLTKNELELEKQCRDCASLADDMIARLNRLADSSKKGRAWKSVGAILKSMWVQKDLENLATRLSKYRDSMNSQLLGSLRERVDQVAQEQFGHTAALSSHIQQIVASALLDIHSSLTRDLEAQTRLIGQLANKLDPIEARNDVDRVLLGGIRGSPATHVITNAEAQRYLYIQIDEARLHSRISEAILGSLFYETIHTRYETVAEAHKETFGWILQPQGSTDSVQWSDFAQWLQRGDGIYYIKGKAGSGKTTLMKYIYEHSSTLDHLYVWAKQTPLHVAGFFFWLGGTKMQKSQEGLLRSLLYEVLHQIPALIPMVFPTQWSKRYSSEIKMQSKGPIESWSLGALSKAFHTLISLEEMPMKLCLFIDGLDEYEGLESEIAALFKQVVLSPYVKVCVSSRPHVPFEDAFALCPQLQLQDLTRNDIRTYVEERLCKNEMMQRLAIKEPAHCQDLAEEITRTAQGVFLWVMLVVSSLLNGLGNRDKISHLQRRLRALPRKLDELYKQMVLKSEEGNESLYQEEASRLYQLIAAANEKPDDWKTVELLSIKSLYLALDKDLLISTAHIYSDEEDLELCIDTDTLLKTRCGGLLEIQHGGAKGLTSNMKISYLHRTVRDFLEAQQTRLVLSHRTDGKGSSAFNPDIAILRSYMFQSGSCVPYTTPDNPFLHLALTYALRVEKNKRLSPQERVALFDSFPHPATWASVIPAAVLCNWRQYILAKSQMDETMLKITSHKSLLHYALSPINGTEIFELHLRPAMVSFLLDLGMDPNAQCGGPSPWLVAVTYLMNRWEKITSQEEYECWREIIEILLKRGADRNAVCRVAGTDESVSAVLFRAFIDNNRFLPAHQRRDFG